MRRALAMGLSSRVCMHMHADAPSPWGSLAVSPWPRRHNRVAMAASPTDQATRHRPLEGLRCDEPSSLLNAVCGGGSRTCRTRGRPTRAGEDRAPGCAMAGRSRPTGAHHIPHRGGTCQYMPRSLPCEHERWKAVGCGLVPGAILGAPLYGRLYLMFATCVNPRARVLSCDVWASCPVRCCEPTTSGGGAE